MNHLAPFFGVIQGDSPALPIGQGIFVRPSLPRHLCQGNLCSSSQRRHSIALISAPSELYFEPYSFWLGISHLLLIEQGSRLHFTATGVYAGCVSPCSGQ